MKTKTTKRIALALLACLTLSSCATWQAHKGQIAQTALILGKRAGAIALQVVIGAAVSRNDEADKQAYLDSLGDAFRAYQDANVLIDGRDIEAIVTLWTPTKPHWGELATDFSKLWDQYQPKTQAEVNAFLEAYAKAVQSPRAPLQ